jgi:glycosyltransferase involved in cell wall biosynthesis
MLRDAMNKVKITHLIQCLSRGGAARSMIATAKYSSKLANFVHRIVSIIPADPKAIEIATAAGLTFTECPDKDKLWYEIEEADIVLVHFWNNPEIYELLSSELPATRLLSWFHVSGDRPPQIVTEELIDYSDFALASSPYTYDLPVFQNLPLEIQLKKTGMVYGAPDFARLRGVRPTPHDAFNVGYIGTVDFVKMHQNYVVMSAQIDIPNVRFIVCGAGSAYPQLKQKARELGVEQKFQFLGYVEDIRSVIQTMDIFGYPLCEGNYSTAELVLQEVMLAGVPPVIFPYGGAQRSIIQNQTGLIVQNEEEYKEAIEYLYKNPKERFRLSRNAKNYARQNFGAENSAKQLNIVFDRLMGSPKKKREWRPCLGRKNLEQSKGSDAFINSLGNTASHFSTSVQSKDVNELFDADKKIALSSPVLCSPGAGGIFHYRNHYPNDPYLRFWSGLVLQQQGRYALAVSEYTNAISLGYGHWRVSCYLSQSAKQAGAEILAQKAMSKLSRANAKKCAERQHNRRLLRNT